jgi:hypothetical protein
MKRKFANCGGIVLVRMSPLKIWDSERPPRIIGTPCLSQSTQNNLVDGSTLDIDIFGSKTL